MDSVTPKDEADFAEADRIVSEGAGLIRAGKALRQRVNTRIRNRRWRHRRTNDGK